MKYLFSFFVFFFSLSSLAYNPDLVHSSSNKRPEFLKEIQVVEKLENSIDLNLEFTNHKGKKVKLAQYFNQGKPVLMTVVYYRCPTLCNLHLNGVLSALKNMELTVGKDFEFVTVSMNHKESPHLANKKRKSYLKSYGRSVSKEAWPFLTGEKANIKKLTKSLGFAFKWDNQTKQYAHMPVAYILSPEAKIKRYLYGMQFEAKTLKLSLQELNNQENLNFLDKVFLFCYRFNPKKNKYTLYSYNIMRAGGLIFAILFLLFIFSFIRSERREKL